ncbi:MAG: trypsin-like peptidase domain-containing protein [Acidobacteria bacterium]|nr:trypsin-like peptidase domain-containing protein [Acidobacteriota bacterium]
MFVKAIEEVGGYTKALHMLQRVWGANRIVPGSATLFFVNSDGWALTCAHVAKNFIEGTKIADRFEAFKTERADIPADRNQKNAINQLERKYGFKPGEVIELHTRLIDCVEGNLNLDIKIHGSLDLALLHFRGVSKILCDNFPVFGRDSSEMKQGMSICRLGFPFPEFSNYGYNALTDSIGWNDQGQEFTPRFPIDGMLTRHVADTSGKIIAFELSTPGIRGQSGGPAFGTDGRVWGMQSLTRHLDLDFDVDVELQRGTKVKRVQDSAFLHVGGCIHLDPIKEFMREHDVKFKEG